MAVADGLEIASIQPQLAYEVEGVNDRLQLAALEREFQQQQATELMQQGVTLLTLRALIYVAQSKSVKMFVLISM